MQQAERGELLPACRSCGCCDLPRTHMHHIFTHTMRSHTTIVSLVSLAVVVQTEMTREGETSARASTVSLWTLAAWDEAKVPAEEGWRNLWRQQHQRHIYRRLEQEPGCAYDVKRWRKCNSLSLLVTVDAAGNLSTNYGLRLDGSLVRSWLALLGLLELIRLACLLIAQCQTAPAARALPSFLFSMHCLHLDTYSM